MNNRQPTTNMQGFFRKVIIEYVCGDLRWLLKHEAPTIGPMLACVMSGVDTAGGMIYGFEKSNSRARSVEFMSSEMSIHKDVAKLIYVCARCGYIHEGIGKLDLSWFTDFGRERPDDILYRHDADHDGEDIVVAASVDGPLALNVVEFVLKFITGVDGIWMHGQHKLKHLPEPNSRDREAFDKASQLDLPPISALFDLVSERVGEIRGSHSYQDILDEVGCRYSCEGYIADDESD